MSMVSIIRHPTTPLLLGCSLIYHLVHDRSRNFLLTFILLRVLSGKITSISGLFQKEKDRNLEKSERSDQQRALEEQIKQLKSQHTRQSTERDDAVAKFEESVRASEALLLRINETEQSNESLRRELAEVKEVSAFLRLVTS